MDKQEASALISEKLNLAHSLLGECVAISEESGVIFHLPWGGEGTDMRGTGATYIPTTATAQEKEWHSLYDYWRTGGWMASAGSC